jgi:Fe-S-cluster-containing hydrogenase component 2
VSSLYLPQHIRCEACDSVVGTFIGGRLKIHVRSRLLVIRKSGDAEITCHHCKRATNLPLRFTLDTENARE